MNSIDLNALDCKTATQEIALRNHIIYKCYLNNPLFRETVSNNANTKNTRQSLVIFDGSTCHLFNVSLSHLWGHYGAKEESKIRPLWDQFVLALCWMI